MPTVPTYNTPQVQTQVQKGPRASGNVPADAFSNPMIEGGAQLAQGFAEYQQKANTAAAEEAAVKFERDKNDLFFNPNSGYFNTQGRDAYENAGEVRKRLEELKKKYSADLKSPQAQQAFDKVATAHITRGVVDIDRHAAKGADAWENASMEASVENTIENAMFYYNDTQRFQTQRMLGQAAVIESAQKQGLSADAVNERVQTYNSSFYFAGIDAASRKSADEAEGILNKYRSQMEAPDVLKAEDIIGKRRKAEKTASVSGMAVIEANRILDQNDDRKGIDAAIREIEDPDLQKACLLYTSPSPRDGLLSRMPSSA